MWNLHPDGGFMGLGTPPVSIIRSLFLLSFGMGTAARSAWEYGWRVLLKSSRDGYDSTILPRYMTAMRLLMCFTTDRSWETKR